MKKFLFTAIAVSAFFYYGCDNPAPTELINDGPADDTFELEIIGKELDNEFYSNGYDTSGVIEDIRQFSSIISVSGIKLTANGRTENISVATGIISDLSSPVYSPQGNLIGYNTITPGTMKFNGEQTRMPFLRVRFREQGVLIDTVLGRKYELFNFRGRFLNDNFEFPYNSEVSFSFNPFFGQPSGFNIPTPSEVTGSVRLNRLPGAGNFRAELNWTGTPAQYFSIIVGGARIGDEKLFPFYRLKTADDGSLIIPASFLENIPRDRFNRISFTFIRKYQGSARIAETELIVSSQSIHTIVVNIP